MAPHPCSLVFDFSKIVTGLLIQQHRTTRIANTSFAKRLSCCKTCWVI